MKYNYLCLIFTLFTFLQACTKGQPDFKTISQDNIPQPMFSGSKVKNIITSNDNSAFAISGECDPKISDLIASANNITVLREMTSNTPTISCASNGRFSFELKSLIDLGYTVTEGSIYEIELRAMTSAGVSKPSYIRITYTTSNGGRQPVLITAGGTGGQKIGAGGFKANVRINYKGNDSANSPAAGADKFFLKQDGNFKAKVGIRNNY